MKTSVDSFILNILSFTSYLVVNTVTCFREDKEWKDREGGFVCILEKETGTPILTSQVGYVKPEKVKKYYELAIKKAFFLFDNKNFITTQEASAEGYDILGGGISGKDFICAFSGFTERGDSSIMIMLLGERLEPKMHEKEKYKLIKSADCQNIFKEMK